MSVDVVLIYPQRAPRRGRHWIMPSLGLAYLDASLKRAGYTCRHLDHTFSERADILAEVRRLQPRVVGIYCMVTMQDEAFALAAELRGSVPLLICGGPYPSGDPEAFADRFDLVCIGEGEQTIVELLQALDGGDLSAVAGLAWRESGGGLHRTPPRTRSKDTSWLPRPHRADLPNAQYIDYWRRHWGEATTPLMSSRGCPFRCDFCHKPVFGDLFRAQGPDAVVAEMREIAALGYDHVWMSDDLFTLNYHRTAELCAAISAADIRTASGRRLTWECLSRVTHVDEALFRQMKAAGCKRIFFGIESGDPGVLKEMRKGITPEQSLAAVEACRRAGIKAAGFFMVGYLGETSDSLLRTVAFSSALPLDYVSYTIAYPLPGTRFFARVEERRKEGEWHKVRHNRLLFNTDFSETKLRAAIWKGAVQHRLRKHRLRPLAAAFERLTDPVLKAMR